jgi:uncharacterized membrane protein SpoIIM required for sporulation
MADGREASLKGWLERRAGAWRAVASRLGRVDAGSASADDVFTLAADYRVLARDVASARRHLPNSRTTRALEDLYGRLHARLDREWRDPRDAVLEWLCVALPASFARVRRHVLAVALLFALSSVAGGWLVASYPELAGLFLGPQMIDSVEAGKLWTDGIFGVVPPSLESIGILSNNIAVSLFAFGFGLLFGLGTFYIVVMNGLLLGAILAFTAQHGLAGGLLRFMIAHGCVELSVICLASGAGAFVGEALARPGGRPRSTALRESVAAVLPLLVACVLLLVGCGLIEGYLSPDPGFPLAARIALGASTWLLMAALLAGVRRGRGPVTPAAAA